MEVYSKMYSSIKVASYKCIAKENIEVLTDGIKLIIVNKQTKGLLVICMTNYA